MALAELEFLGVFDSDDALVRGDERRQDIQQSRLAGAGAAGHQDVGPAFDAGLEKFADLRCKSAEADQVLAMCTGRWRTYG